MKKFIATLTVIVAAALGVQGQMTIEFPLSGIVSPTDLMFKAATSSPAIADNKVRLLLAVSSLPAGVTVTLSGMTLVGNGITGGPSVPYATTIAAGDFAFTPLADLISLGPSYNFSASRAALTITINN